MRESEDLAKKDFVRVQRKEGKGKAGEGWRGLELQNDGPNWYFKVRKGPQVRPYFDTLAITLYAIE